MVTEKPLLKIKPLPYIPDDLDKKLKKEKVLVTITINELGYVEFAEIFRPTELILKHSAIDAAMKCEFTPAKQKGKAIRVKINIPVSFNRSL